MVTQQVSQFSKKSVTFPKMKVMNRRNLVKAAASGTLCAIYAVAPKGSDGPASIFYFL